MHGANKQCSYIMYTDHASVRRDLRIVVRTLVWFDAGTFAFRGRDAQSVGDCEILPRSTTHQAAEICRQAG